MNDLLHETLEGSPYDAPAPRPTREELRERLAAIRFWQVQGLDRIEVQRNAMAAWQISQRTAQKYVRKAGRNLAREAGREDRLSVLRLSQLQRERLLGHISKRLVDTEDMDDKRLVLLVNAARTLIDGRDRAVKAIGLTQYVARDEAPKSERKPKPRPNGPRKEFENDARRNPDRRSPPAPALGGDGRGEGANHAHVSDPLAPDPAPAKLGIGKAAAAGPTEQLPAPQPVASPRTQPRQPISGPLQGPQAKPSERPPTEQAMHERCADIMEEMEAMIKFVRANPRPVAAMGRYPEAAHGAAKQDAPALKSKPNKEIASAEALIPDGS